MTALSALALTLALAAPGILTTSTAVPAAVHAPTSRPPAAAAGPGAPAPAARRSARRSAPSAGTVPSGRAAVARTESSNRWVWPIGPDRGGAPRVARPFDAPRERWSAGHRGVDLATAVEAPVFAPDDGVVAFTGSVAGRGTLSIDHAGGLRSTFEPVTAVVPTGRAVRRGDVVGLVATGAGHCAPAACLHLGARRGRDYLDPLTLLRGPSPVLLPP